MAMVTNGTAPVAYEEDWNNAAARIEQKDYQFVRSWEKPKNQFPKIASSGRKIMPYRVEKPGDEVEPISPYTYAEAYRRFEEILKSDQAPVYFDEFEYAIGREMRDLWPGGHTYVQHAPLIYDLL